MKKTIGLITILILTLFLMSCNNETLLTRNFELDHEGIMTTLVYTYKDDKVIKQTAKNIIPYDLIGVSSKEEAQVILNPVSEQFQGFEGLNHKIEYHDSEAIEIIDVDYEVLNFKEVQHLPGMTFDGDADKYGISMEKSAELLINDGFIEVEK